MFHQLKTSQIHTERILYNCDDMVVVDGIVLKAE